MIERASPIVVVAPHGGRIEAGTSQTATLVASEDFSLYCFEGLVSGRRLHITSARFDEPKGLALVEASGNAVAIHGRADKGDHQTVWMGGLHHVLRDAIGGALFDVNLTVPNRLKTLKRAMYGRAGIDLLLARMLPFEPVART